MAEEALRQELVETQEKLEALKAQKGSLSLLQNDVKAKAEEIEKLKEQVSKERATSKANLQKVMKITSEKKAVEEELSMAKKDLESRHQPGNGARHCLRVGANARMRRSPGPAGRARRHPCAGDAAPRGQRRARDLDGRGRAAEGRQKSGRGR